jgi:hypothetical protein
MIFFIVLNGRFLTSTHHIQNSFSSSQYPLLSSQCVTLGSEFFIVWLLHSYTCRHKLLIYSECKKVNEIPVSRTGMTGEGSYLNNEREYRNDEKGATRMTKGNARSLLLLHVKNNHKFIRIHIT